MQLLPRVARIERELLAHMVARPTYGALANASQWSVGAACIVCIRHDDVACCVRAHPPLERRWIRAVVIEKSADKGGLYVQSIDYGPTLFVERADVPTRVRLAPPNLVGHAPLMWAGKMDELCEPWLVHATHTSVARKMLLAEPHACKAASKSVDPLAPPMARIVAETKGRRKTTSAAQIPCRMSVYTADPATADEVTAKEIG